ncbi:MAG: aldehyde dehydrogenase [Candidatus Limnocylindrales bacterium]
MTLSSDVRSRKTYSRLFIDGDWVAAHGSTTYESIDPSTGDPWAEIVQGDATDVDRAVEAARSALSGPWGRMAASERGRLIYRLAALVENNVDRLAELESRDNGKPLRDARDEVSRAADWLRFFAGAADKINGETIPVRHNALAYTVREPIGVVAAITPWNSPFYLYSWKLGPALAAGNTVILKPATLTSVTALELADLVATAGFPHGVFNVVTGPGAEVGGALAAHGSVDKVTVTGDYRTAQEIMRAATGNLKRISLECGGKSPQIIFADADLTRALPVAVHSAFRSTGQSCALGSRLLVERPIYDEVLEELSGRVAKIRVGLPLDPATHIGPQASEEQLNKTLSYVEVGKQEGARLVFGGHRLEDPPLQRGYFVEPTVFADVDNHSRLAQEEIFGPVLAVIPFDGERDAVAAANDTRFGLVAGMWTRDVSRAHRVASQLDAGFVMINCFRAGHWMLPYGGHKLSGIGRENGLESLRDYTELKTVLVDLAESPPEDPFGQ